MPSRGAAGSKFIVYGRDGLDCNKTSSADVYVRLATGRTWRTAFGLPGSDSTGRLDYDNSKSSDCPAT